ncbi:DUF7344 domain-containing protein [Halovivax asiaticus]|nr:hypothetical protein [Halovivax asiaticus]
MDFPPPNNRSEHGLDVSGSVDHIQALSSPRRIATLTALARRDESMRVEDLASHVRALERETDVSAVSRREQRRVQTSLQHAHLPALAARSLVEWEHEADWVALHPDVSSEELRETVGEAHPTASTRHIRTLSDPRRRQVLELVEEYDTPLSIDTLARQVASFETGGGSSSPPAQTMDRVRISLVHSHLPALDDAGLLTYDEETGTVTSTALSPVGDE